MHKTWSPRIGKKPYVILLATIATISGGVFAWAQQPPDEASPAAVVQMTDQPNFLPAKVTVKVGQTVQWKNAPSRMVHTVTAVLNLAKNPQHVQLPAGAEPFNSGELQPGETFSHTFEVPGLYRYFCIPHELKGMVAEVEVVPADE